MNDCIFCKIITKEIPSYGVYEDDKTYAFLDINPVNPGHVLIVPKKHFSGLHDADQQTLHDLIDTTQKTAKALMSALGTDAFNLEENNGKIAGQVISHLHMHVVPRRADDGLKHWPGRPYAVGEAETIAENIRKSMT